MMPLSQTERLIKMLELAGSEGVASVEFVSSEARLLKYTQRIADARKRGFEIVGFPMKDSAQWLYFLIAKPSGGTILSVARCYNIAKGVERRSHRVAV